MASPAVLESLHDAEALTFEALGSQLQEAMASFAHHLKEDGHPLPSLHLNSNERPRTKNPIALAEKARIIKLCNMISTMTMDPEMYLLTTSFQFHFCSCLKTAVDLRIHEHIPRAGRIAAHELAAAVGAEEKLLRRIMRLLVSKSVFAEPEPGHYSHTTVSLVLCRENMTDLLNHRLEDSFRSASRYAESLAKMGYREPTLDDMLGFHLAFSTNKSFWDYMQQDDPECGIPFAKVMRATPVSALEDIPNLYPFDNLVRDGGVIVDVGGGSGQVADKIMSHWPDVGLQCIVQDKFAASSPDTTGLDIKTQVHDFFTPQPIKGAAAYLFRHIFHDWPDDACVKILRHTVEAMDIRRSRILVCDQVMAEVDPSTVAVLYDIDMMALFGGKERTLCEWEALFKAADPRLHISSVMACQDSATAVLEVRLRSI